MMKRPVDHAARLVSGECRNEADDALVPGFLRRGAACLTVLTCSTDPPP